MAHISTHISNASQLQQNRPAPRTQRGIADARYTFLYPMIHYLVCHCWFCWLNNPGSHHHPSKDCDQAQSQVNSKAFSTFFENLDPPDILCQGCGASIRSAIMISGKEEFYRIHPRAKSGPLHCPIPFVPYLLAFLLKDTPRLLKRVQSQLHGIDLVNMSASTYATAITSQDQLGFPLLWIVLRAIVDVVGDPRPPQPHRPRLKSRTTC